MSRKPRILVLGKTLPLHDRASGDYRLFRFLEILVRGGFEVDFLSTTQTAIHKSSGKVEYFVRDSIFPSHKLELIDSRYISDLETIGVNPLNKKEIAPFAVRSAARYDIRPFLKESSYDLVWIEFYYLAEEYVDDIRCLQPQARVICDSVDLHFRRLARECNFNEANARYLVNSRQEKRKIGKRYRQHLIDQRRHADYVREAEIRAYLKCDAVAMVSEDDHQELARHCPSLPLLRVPNIHKRPTVAATEIPLRERSGCLFVGNFDHSPNLSSCVFLKQIGRAHV